MEKSIFNLTIIQDGEVISIHASHTGEKSTAFAAGMSLVDQLSGPDGLAQTFNSFHLPAARWVQ